MIDVFVHDEAAVRFEVVVNHIRKEKMIFKAEPTVQKGGFS